MEMGEATRLTFCPVFSKSSATIRKQKNQTNQPTKEILVPILFRTKIWSNTHQKTKAFPKHQQTGAQLQRTNVLRLTLKHTWKDSQNDPCGSSSILSNNYFIAYDKELQRLPLSHQCKSKMFNFWEDCGLEGFFSFWEQQNRIKLMLFFTVSL